MEILSPLSEILLAIKPDAPELYIRDRDQAFRWYQQKGFPRNDYKTVFGANWFASMSHGADDDGLWKEAWAGFHHALAGYLELKMQEEVPVICWHLGRAHTAQEQYDLASLYLESGRRLSAQQNNSQLTSRILLEEAVLAKLIKQSNINQLAMERVFAVIFPSGQPSSLAESAAMTLFREGKKNHEWRIEGQPVRSCLIHASGYYEVSLEFFRKLNNKKGITFNLINLGDVWRKLGEKDRALVCLREALKHLSETGDQNNIKLVNEWISEI